MATTIASAFDQFRQNLEITQLQTAVVSTRHYGVRDVVRAGMQVEEDFLTGSYARSTMIAPLTEADIDVFIVLNSRYFYDFQNQGGPRGLLDAVRQILLRTYTRTPSISRNGQAVTIRFEDFTVDVVPAFHRKGGGYLIPNALSNRYIQTDPKRHVDIFANANALHSGLLVPLIKMLKHWNRSSGSFFTSFHLEVLALQVFTNVTISDHSSGVRFFFDRARAVVGQQPDPAGYGDNVGSYLDSQQKLDEARRRLTKAYEIAIGAESWAGSSGLYTRTAMDEWRKLFPNYFPTYG